MLASLGASVAGSPDAPKMLVGTGSDKVSRLGGVQLVNVAEDGAKVQYSTNYSASNDSNSCSCPAANISSCRCTCRASSNCSSHRRLAHNFYISDCYNGSKLNNLHLPNFRVSVTSLSSIITTNQKNWNK
jgi:hypothetical protein